MSNEPGAGEQPGTPSTSGIALRARSHWLREAVELFSSMRFAISVLTIIAIASVVGTVVRQNQPMITYVDQFGPFWYEVFKSLSLYTLYTAGWFFVLLAFLVVSTTLCIARNAPRFLREMREHGITVIGITASKGKSTPQAHHRTLMRAGGGLGAVHVARAGCGLQPTFTPVR